ATATSTPIPPNSTSSETAYPTATPTAGSMDTATPSALHSDAPTATSTETANASPIFTATPESTEAALPVTVIIEGPIQSINGNILVIFNLTVIVNANDPILSTLKVGEVVRVEGNLDNATQVITAIRITTITVETDVNPSSGQVWQDNGT